ncbi:MAG: hypothetical protein ACYCWC_04070 [Rhodocyclaceae bacterium]
MRVVAQRVKEAKMGRTQLALMQEMDHNGLRSLLNPPRKNSGKASA